MHLIQAFSSAVRRAKKMLKVKGKTVKPFWAPVAFVMIFGLSINTFVATPAGAANSTDTGLDGFQLTNGMTLNGGQQAGTGRFTNGSFTDYFEGSCIPFVLTLENTDKNGVAQDITETIRFDYSSTQDRFTDLESITSSVADPLASADDLNDFTISGTPLSSGTVQTKNGASVSLIVTGPTSNPGDTERTYTVMGDNVPGDDVAYVLFCARLGEDAGAINGRSTSVRLGNGGAQNAGVGSSGLIELPSLTVSKQVTGAAAPDAWSFIVTPGLDGVSSSSTLDIADGESSVTFSNIPVSASTVFTVTETGGPTGYSFASGSGASCVFSGSTATATVAPADNNPTNASCTFTNAELTQPQLTIIKNVINDNGGTAVAGDFSFEVTGTNPSSSFVSGSETGITITLDPGAYSVDEIATVGYSDSPSTDCSGIIAYGETKTCTITNNDLPGTLTVVKVVDNTAGGTMGSKDFLMTVTGSFPDSAQTTQSFEGSLLGTTVQMNAGAYSVDESLVVNYSGQKSADCSGTISNGEAKICTITNTYVVPSPTQGTIIVQKHVVNDSGFGTDVAADFMLNVHDVHGTVIPVTGSETGVTVLIDPGQYSVSEAADSAYAQSFGSGCAGSIAAGETRTCLVTNDDYPAVLPTTDILPSLQCVAPTNHNTYTAYFGYNNTNSTSVYLPIGNDNSVTGGGLQGNSYGQPEIFTAGASGSYPVSAFSVEFDGTAVTWLLRVAGDSTSVIASSDSARCPTVQPARVHVFTEIIRDNDGPALNVFDTFSTVDSEGPDQTFENDNDGVWVTINPGTYGVTSTAASGYTVSYSPDCVGDIVQGESLICTITYNDVAQGGGGGGGGGGSGSGGSPKTTGVTVITNVINDNGGLLSASAFEVHVNGEDPALTSGFNMSAVSTINFVGNASGVSVALSAGSYSVTQTNASGYSVTMSAGCSGSLGSGQVATCTITNDDIAAAASTPAPTPTPIVLGDTDTADDTVVLPTPEVLGATDEELPRTGFPIGMLAVWLGGAAYVSFRAHKKQ